MAFDVVLYPKNSLLQQENILLLCILIFGILMVGILFSQMGAWPILGFCGIEIIVLSLTFYAMHLRNYQRERVMVTNEHVVIEDYNWRGQKQSWQLNRPWINIKDLSAPKAGIIISSKEQAVAIGAFLRDEEKKSFITALKTALRN